MATSNLTSELHNLHISDQDPESSCHLRTEFREPSDDPFKVADIWISVKHDFKQGGAVSGMVAKDSSSSAIPIVAKDSSSSAIPIEIEPYDSVINQIAFEHICKRSAWDLRNYSDADVSAMYWEEMDRCYEEEYVKKIEEMPEDPDDMDIQQEEPKTTE